MRLRRLITHEPVAPGAEIVSRTTQRYTLVGYEPDGAGSGFVIALPAGKWGVKNHEEYRPQFFGLEVAP